MTIEVVKNRRVRAHLLERHGVNGVDSLPLLLSCVQRSQNIKSLFRVKDFVLFCSYLQSTIIVY